MHAFSELPLRAELLEAIAAQGYEKPTPIQARTIPVSLEGRDVLGIAQTGTGKTAAFTLPILERLSPVRGQPRTPHPRSLILAPTRELAGQIGESLAAYGANLPLRHAVIFGGVGQTPQVNSLRRGVDILVATPGRLLDLMTQGHVRLDAVEVFVLDEADRMLDMGFIHDVRKIITRLPAQRQTLFFSATMPQEVNGLAHQVLNDPVRIEVTPVASTGTRVEQRVIFVRAVDKRPLLVDLLAQDAGMNRVMVFTRTKHGANKVAEHLERAGISTAAIHGNKSQNARQSALEGFRSGTVRVLVATDIAARGIDVDGVSHVVNFDLPNVAESYVHRIGRTARAGAAGVAIAFCDDGEERGFLRAIERLTRVPLTVTASPPRRAASALAPAFPAALPPPVRSVAEPAGSVAGREAQRSQRRPGGHSGRGPRPDSVGSPPARNPGGPASSARGPSPHPAKRPPPAGPRRNGGGDHVPSRPHRSDGDFGALVAGINGRGR